MTVAATRPVRVRTPIGTVQLETWGVTLFAGEREIARYAATKGAIAQVKALWAELDNLGRLLYTHPANLREYDVLQAWIDELLLAARDVD